MSRLAPQMVFLGLVTIWSLATPPTTTSPLAEVATTDGRIQFPRSVGTTLGIRLRTEAAHVFVVPRSMPTMRCFSAMGRPICTTTSGGPLCFGGAREQRARLGAEPGIRVLLT